MAKVKVGEKALDFTFNTIFEKDLKFSDVVKKADKTIVHFLRYYGCPTCQLDIRDYMKLIDKIEEKNAQVYVVLQSKPEILIAALGEEKLPFDIICDPDQEIYKLYDIGSLTDRSLVDMDKMKGKIERIKELGIEHGEYEGNEQQLTAIFVVDKDMELKHAQYSVTVTDMPSPTEVVDTLI